MIHTKAIVTAMEALWNHDPNMIERIAEHFKSLDGTYEYIEFMEGYEIEDPKEAWEMWCNDQNIEHETDNNPFQ